MEIFATSHVPFPIVLCKYLLIGEKGRSRTSELWGKQIHISL